MLHLHCLEVYRMNRKRFVVLEVFSIHYYKLNLRVFINNIKHFFIYEIYLLWYTHHNKLKGKSAALFVCPWIKNEIVRIELLLYLLDIQYNICNIVLFLSRTFISTNRKTSIFPQKSIPSTWNYSRNTKLHFSYTFTLYLCVYLWMHNIIYS